MWGRGRLRVTEARKREHMQLALAAPARGYVPAGWDDIHLVPVSLPGISADDIDVTTTFLGCHLRAPLVIAGMTGGHSHATKINASLARTAEEFGLAIGVGSQRAALEEPTLAPSYTIVRECAPSTMVLANLGAAQFVRQRGSSQQTYGPREIERAVSMVRADALAIHLNVLEEMVQPEGDRHCTSYLAAIGDVTAAAGVPVVAKETGAGLDARSARALSRAGVAALDVGGAGGTNFAVIEALRADRRGDTRSARIGRTFAGWGIPTAASILEVRYAGPPVIATGGVRNGLDMAKALALGADIVGVGRPFLAAAGRRPDELNNEVETWLSELRLAMLLCGVSTISELRKHPLVLTGATHRWEQQRTGRL
jgi:isopentenyl-diphosphate delta-isomerase